jgi:hypothetical protein
MNYAEAFSCTPHKRLRRLTPKLQKRAIYGRKLARAVTYHFNIYNIFKGTTSGEDQTLREY